MWLWLLWTYHGKGECPPFGKECHKCGGKNHFEKKAGPKRDLSESQDMTHGGQVGPMEEDAHTDLCMR